MNPQTHIAALSATPNRELAARRFVKICNQKGLHARAAARFVKMASNSRRR